MRTEHLIKGALFAAATLCAGFVPQSGLAQSNLTTGSEQVFDGSKARVNHSSKLRMLSQKVGSASCRLNAGIGVEAAKEELQNSRVEFNTIMNGLENGSMALGIPSAEKSRVVLKSIKAVKDAWKPIDDAAQTLVSSGGNADAAQIIANENLKLLEATMILSSDLSGRYSNPHELTQADAMALNIAGRQRMLGHRIAKEVCDIATQNTASTDGLGQSLDMYSISLTALRDGMVDAGVNPPPNDVVREELAAVSEVWTASKPVLDAIRGGMQPSSENVEAMAQVSSALMTDMNNVVTLYMLATPGQEDVYRVPLRAYAEQQLSKWLENDGLISAIRAQNEAHRGLSQADIDQLDKDWRAQRKQDDKPLIDRLLSQPASAWLRDQQAQTASFVTEVFAMDNHGLNVAQSVETSDYWQGDEAKWQKTFGNGSGDIHISEVEFDESTGSYQSQVSMPVTDPATGEMIGAITFGINVQSLL
ncbi:MAG: type IV pili methyl-accepting chemotaxis transducer N-terminal domain-containing protein [Paracoccaceae bacterium]|nr:type IV pili methyl-accepting chemotaxis transducer N-terminal domain-containing protein [Paracoccaceae bacterium]